MTFATGGVPHDGPQQGFLLSHLPVICLREPPGYLQTCPLPVPGLQGSLRIWAHQVLFLMLHSVRMKVTRLFANK